jgi:hypothetical protein
LYFGSFKIAGIHRSIRRRVIKQIAQIKMGFAIAIAHTQQEITL